MQSLLNSRRIGTERGPSPSIFDANIVIIIPLKLEHIEGISNAWLHCPLVHAEARIVTRSHVLPELGSEYVIV